MNQPNLQPDQEHARPLSWLAYLSTLPLLLAVLLAMHKHWDWSGFTGMPMSFAHINAYIYAHSYGAMLLCLSVGIQIGWLLHRSPTAGLILAYFSLLPVAWFSQQSYADLLGVGLLTCCWLVASLLDWQVARTEAQAAWLWRLKWRINTLVVAMLLTIMGLNG
ncbi:hypothetical protein [Marinicella meishanensis]|uniref:hypothetical protein n=1 Tax=Marinicella meishanensis TaxID=2873263 RepID=UPI001CC0C4DE|nr:hypothetical protein [Marinicella sp. NBU2979]